MIQGKYWITPHGLVDVTTSEHALYAKNNMLKLARTRGEIRLDRTLFSALTSRQIAVHRRRGIPAKVLHFLSVKNDPRIFAIREYGWIRVRQSGIYVWRLNAAVLRRVRQCTQFWEGQRQLRKSDVVTVWEIASHDCFNITVRELTGARVRLNDLLSRRRTHWTEE